jgi:hypothetical protein
MIMGRFSTRAVLMGSIAGLCSTVIGGGLLIGLVEGTGPRGGIWLAFNSVTTTGFGTGPATAMGQLLLMALFILGACCWFGVLLVALEAASMRFQKHALIDEALRPLARRPRDRLFHVN